MKTLFLFTGSYPYSAAAEDTFLPQELAVLRGHFHRIVVVPISTRGTRVAIDLPGVDVDTSYAASATPRWRQLLAAVASLGDGEFRRELGTAFRLGRRTLSPVLRAVVHQAHARLAEQWARRRTARSAASESCVYYTWWFDGVTLGLARAAGGSATPVVTRAHGFDLYESRYNPPYIPFRREALTRVSRVYPDSHAGALYLAERHPSHADKIDARLLGVDDPGFINPASTDEVFRLLSCSFIRPVKRIDLIIQSLAWLGRQRPERQFAWTHIGNGRDREALTALAQQIVPGNVRIEFRDYPGKDRLLDFYRSTPVDLFMNVSQSEGTPVSIMEAISVGIPVLATSVGGNTEIVGPENGIVVSPDPTPLEIAATISMLADDPGMCRRLRDGSRAKWERDYDARRNYDAFATIIKAL